MTLALSYLLTVLGIAGGEPTFVQADLLRLRSEPNSEAAVRGVVRLNTELRVETVEGDWAKVSHAPSTTTGWTLTRFLGPRPVELSALQVPSPEAKPEERVSTLERWLALEPNRPELYSQLAQAYREAGKTERTAHLERRLKGQLPTMLAVCLSEPGEGAYPMRSNVALVASFTRGALRPRTLAPQVSSARGEGVSTPLAAYDAPEAQPLWALASDAPSLFWVRAGDEAAPPGTPFPSPGVELFQVESSSFYAVQLSKDACKHGELWASAPFKRATLTPRQKAALKAFDAAHPLRSDDGREVRLYTDASAPWIQPLFSDGSVLTARFFTGGMDPVNYYGIDLVRISPKNQVQRHVVRLYGRLQ